MPVRKCSTCNKTELMATKDDILKASTQAQQPQQTTPSAAQTQPQPSAEAETKQQPSQPSQPPISTGAATPPVQTTAGEATAQPQQTGIAAGKTLKNSTDKAETHLNKAYTQVTKGNEKESKDRAMTKQKEAEDREQKRYRTKAILAALGDGISSLANLYYTTRGAQGIPQPAVSLSEVARKRFDEAKRRKEKMEDEFRAALIRAGFAERAEAFQERQRQANNADAAARAAEQRAADKEAREQQHQWEAEEAQKKREFTQEENERERAARRESQERQMAQQWTLAKMRSAGSRGESRSDFSGQLSEQENALYDLAVNYGFAPQEGDFYTSKQTRSTTRKNGVESASQNEERKPYYRNEITPSEQQRVLRIGSTIQQLLDMGWNEKDIEAVKADIEKGLSAREIDGNTYRFIPYDLPDLAKERKYEQYDMDDNNFEQYQVTK
jgi:hypothetical protein